MRRCLGILTVLLFLTGLGPAASWSAEFTPDAHTLALYHFNEGSGTTALDAGPNGLHGTITGATYVTGRYGTGLDFCGNAGCYVRVPHNALLQPPTGITVEAWIYNRGGGAVEATIARYVDDCSAGYRIRLYNDVFSVIVNGPSSCGGQYVDVHADASAYLNQWAHYAFTYDAAIGTRLYINDALVASAPPVSYFPQYSGDLFLGGATVHPNDGGVNGIMDEVRISDVAREPGCQPVGFDLDPDRLNLASHGRWVTGYLRVSSPYDVSQIDVASLRLNGVVPADPAFGGRIEDGTLTVKFSRNALQALLPPGEAVPVEVTGTMGEACLVGTDYIAVSGFAEHPFRTGDEPRSGRTPVATGEPSPAAIGAGMTANPSTLSLRVVSPGPARPTVWYSLPGPAPATLSVYDVRGRRLESREAASGGAGWHAIQLGALPAGVYLVRLDQGNHRTSSHMVVVR